MLVYQRVCFSSESTMELINCQNDSKCFFHLCPLSAAWKTRVLLNRAACPGVVVCQLLCIRWQPSRPILHWILPLLVLAAGSEVDLLPL